MDHPIRKLSCDYIVKPLFDDQNLPPVMAKPTVSQFAPMTFQDVEPAEKEPKDTQKSINVKSLDPSLSDIEIHRVEQILGDLESRKTKHEFADEIVKLIVDQTEQIFQFVIVYNNQSSSEIIVEFTGMLNEVASFRKSHSMLNFFSEKKTFEDMLAVLRSSLTKAKAVECRFDAELTRINKTQRSVEQHAKTCKNYLKYVRQYAIAGNAYLKDHQDEHVEIMVEKLEGIYMTTLTTAIAQLDMVCKTNSIVADRVQEIIQVKIPQWKQNAASILVIAEQKKLKNFDVDLEANFDALLKLI